MLQGDFFLRNVCDEFMEGARLLIFEAYCRIHNKLDISMLASKMGIENVMSVVVIAVAMNLKRTNPNHFSLQLGDSGGYLL